MDAYWLNKLIDVLYVQTNSANEKLMVLFLDRELNKLKLSYTIDPAGNVIVTKGKAKTYPCVTSHMDTVHDFAKNFKVYEDEENTDILFAMDGKIRVGIGGDDKCGVFACLYLLKVIPQIKVVFFSKEESGCKGSSDIDKSFFADCRYLIQLDRRGKGDFIHTYWGDKTVSHDFSSEIGLIKKRYGYKNQKGTVTDVMKLWRNKVGISCINISCGYYEPHSNCEYISINDLWNSIKFTEEIINTMKPKRYTSLPPKPTVVTNTSSAYSGSPIYDQCYKCKAWKRDILLYKEWSVSTLKHERVCWNCKKKSPKKGKGNTNDKKVIITPKMKNTSDNNLCITKFACVECGITIGEMKNGASLVCIDDLPYCANCASLFAHSVDDNSNFAICWLCGKAVPKDQKIIERYGSQICEDCATPSDTIIS